MITDDAEDGDQTPPPPPPPPLPSEISDKPLNNGHITTAAGLYSSNPARKNGKQVRQSHSLFSLSLSYL